MQQKYNGIDIDAIHEDLRRNQSLKLYFEALYHEEKGKRDKLEKEMIQYLEMLKEYDSTDDIIQ